MNAKAGLQGGTGDIIRGAESGTGCERLADTGDTLPVVFGDGGEQEGDTSTPLSDAEDGADGSVGASPSNSDDTGEQARQTKNMGRKRGAAQTASKLSGLRKSKHDSLVWSEVKNTVRMSLATLNDNFKKAHAKLAEIRKTRIDPDLRTLTYKQIENALSDLKNFKAVAKKLEKCDYTLYGIRVQGGGQMGTRVKHLENNKTGQVTRCFVDEYDGYNRFDIQWDNCGGECRYSTREVLEGAERHGGEQDVASPGADDEALGKFLQAVLCMVNIQVRKFVCEDDTAFSRKRVPVALSSDVLDKVMGVRKEAWKTIKTARLTETMTACEKSILRKAERGLLEEAGKRGSLLDALGLLPFAKTETLGFVESAYTFHERHETFVNHFVRGAQVSWKLGRPTSLESCIIPLSAGVASGTETQGEVNELAGVEITDHESAQTLCTIDSSKEETLGLGLRLALSRARLSNSFGADSFKWWTHFPLYKQFEFTRPKRLGCISPTTENTGRASQVRRNRAFYESACAGSSGGPSVLKHIFKAYIPVAMEKRNEAAAHENNLARVGRGSKVNAGRTFSVDEWDAKCETLCKLVRENGIDPIMEKIGDDETRAKVIAMCLEVLQDGGGASMGTRTDESHLYPDNHKELIDEAVGVLAKAGVSVEDLERFSCALHVVDSLTAACLRPQDSLGCMACKAYVKNGRLMFLLPVVGKNSRTLLKNSSGMVVNHVKADETTGESFICCVVIRIWVESWRVKMLYREYIDMCD